MVPNDEDQPQGQFSTKPLYLQARDALVKRIMGGEWKPGISIPSEGDLAREMGVSPGTVRKALDLLESEHLLTRRQGRGTFVTDRNSMEMVLRFTNIRNSNGERLVDSVTSCSIVTGEATDLECARLRLEPRSPVYRIRRVRLTGGRPYMADETSMPCEPFPGLAEKEHLSQHICVLLGQYGILPGQARERISAGAATPAVAATLGLASGSPIVVLDRVVFSLDGNPVEWRIGYCHFAEEYYLAKTA